MDPVELTNSEGMRESEVLIIPSVSDSGVLTLNVTTNSTMNTNTLYRANVITATGMVDVASTQFCKCTVT